MCSSDLEDNRSKTKKKKEEGNVARTDGNEQKQSNQIDNTFAERRKEDDNTFAERQKEEERRREVERLNQLALLKAVEDQVKEERHREEERLRKEDRLGEEEDVKLATTFKELLETGRYTPNSSP